jgi:hypothetical protein
VFCLLVSKRIEVLAAGATAFEPPSSTMMKVVPAAGNAADAKPAPEAQLSPEKAAKVQAIREFATKIETLNYFEMLGVGEDATKEAVAEAYRQLAKTWHPDRISPDLHEIKPLAAHSQTTPSGRST